MRRTKSDSNFEVGFYKTVLHNLNCTRLNILSNNMLTNSGKIKKLDELTIKVNKDIRLTEIQKDIFCKRITESIEKLNKEIYESKYPFNRKPLNNKSSEDETQFNMEM